MPGLPGVVLTVHLLCFAGLAGAQTSVAQNFPTFPGGNPPFNYLGWDDSVGADLEITHNTLGQPIIFGTAGTERMRILPNGRVRVGPSAGSHPAQLNIFPEATHEAGIAAGIHGFDQEGFSHGLNVTLLETRPTGLIRHE